MKFVITTILSLLCLLTVKATADNGEYYGLFIAIDQYESDHLGPIAKATTDAELLKSTLETQYKFGTSISLYNEKATKEQILKTINLVSQQISEDDHLVVFFSGHSMVKGGEGYWAPYDATDMEEANLISSSAIRNVLEGASAGHILVLSDAEFRGEFIRPTTNIPKQLTASYYNTMNRLISRQVISSGYARPIFDSDKDESIFVKYLLKFLTTNKKPFIDANELFQLMKYAISANSSSIPIAGHLQDTGHEGGQFIFIQDVPEGEKGLQDDNLVPVNLAVEEEVKEEEELPNVDVIIEEGNEVEFTLKGEVNAKATSDNVVFNWYKNGFLIGEESRLEVKSSGIYTIIVKTPEDRELATAVTKITVKERKYIVKIGDNLERIATLFYDDPLKAKIIRDANEFDSNDALLKVGAQIIIPNDVEDITAIAKNLIVAGANDFAPFSGESLYKEGMMVEIVNRVFEEMGLKCKTSFMDWNQAKASTLNGQTLGVYPAVKNAQDKTKFIYSSPLYRVANVFFEPKGANTDFSKPSKIRGKVVAIRRGYEIPELIDLYKKNYVRIRPCRTLKECFELLEKGEVDLVAASQFVGLSLVKAEYKSVNHFGVVSEPLGYSSLHLAVSNQFDGSEVVIQQFNRYYRRLKSQGVISEIRDRHIDLIQKD